GLENAADPSTERRFCRAEGFRPGRGSPETVAREIEVLVLQRGGGVRLCGGCGAVRCLRLAVSRLLLSSRCVAGLRLRMTGLCVAKMRSLRCVGRLRRRRCRSVSARRVAAADRVGGHVRLLSECGSWTAERGLSREGDSFQHPGQYQ